jgi:hypothetical protein
MMEHVHNAAGQALHFFNTNTQAKTWLPVL